MSLCTTVTDRIKADLLINLLDPTYQPAKANSEGNDPRFNSQGAAVSWIDYQIVADSKKCEIDTPEMLINYFLQNGNRIPDRRVNKGKGATAGYEMDILIKLGFVTIVGSWFTLDKDLVQVLQLVDQRYQIRKLNTSFRESLALVK